MCSTRMRAAWWTPWTPRRLRGNKFLYDNYDGRRAVVAEETESSESEDEKAPSSSTTSEAESEELIRDGELPNAEPAQQAP